MGILKHLLFWPVTGPLFLAEFAMDKVEGVVREELTDDTPVKAALLELQLELELGDIDDAEYVRREAELMSRLREVREWRERFGMGVAGGVVKVAAPEEGEPESEEPPPAPEEGPSVADPHGATIELNFDWE
ncbi:MAG TPA: gas vesicle protein GvpG [Longimicrobiales bacterium]|nr:gas vesicle protein GvpG [Longimicrobiales bacterium]